MPGGIAVFCVVAIGVAFVLAILSAPSGGD